MGRGQTNTQKTDTRTLRLLDRIGQVGRFDENVLILLMLPGELLGTDRHTDKQTNKHTYTDIMNNRLIKPTRY